jgi:hypothetical protein
MLMIGHTEYRMMHALHVIQQCCSVSALMSTMSRKYSIQHGGGEVQSSLGSKQKEKKNLKNFL